MRKLNFKTFVWSVLNPAINFIDRGGSKIGFYLAYVSGDLPQNVSYSFTLVNYTNPIKSCKNKFKDSGSNFIDGNKKPKPGGLGASDIITHEKIIKDQGEYFPNGKLRFVAKIVFTYHESPLGIIPLAATILKRSYDKMQHSDVNFRSSDKELIPAHKVTLCASSEVFEAMFTYEGTTENETGIIEASDLHSDIIKDMLRFIYCEAFFEKLENAENQEIALYNAAEKYQIEGLKNICVHSIYDRLDVENVIEVSEFAELFNLKQLLSCCTLIILA